MAKRVCGAASSLAMRPDRGEDAIDTRQIVVFQARQRDDGVIARHTLDRREQRQQAGTGKLCGNLGPEAARQWRLVTDDAASGLRHRQDGCDIQRYQGRDIDPPQSAFRE